MMDEFRAGRARVPVVYLDNHLLGVVKPCNLPVQRDQSGDIDLLTAAKAYIGETFMKPGNVYLGLVHRLDRPVGGAMVLARTSKAAKRLSEAFRLHAVDKRYLAVVRGPVAQPLHLVDYLKKDEASGMVSVVDEGTAGAKRAELTSTPIASAGDLTLVEVRLMTGRAHQIRVQHAHAGHGLWGDARYANGQPGQQIALWSCSLTFDHPTTGEAVVLRSIPAGGIWATFCEAIARWEMCNGEA